MRGIALVSTARVGDIVLRSFGAVCLALFSLALSNLAAHADATEDKTAVAQAFANMQRTADEYHCGAVGYVAEVVMKLRQAGLSPTEVMNQVTPMDGLDIRAVTKSAFASRRERSKSSISIVAEEFRNMYEAVCLNLLP